MHSCELPPAAPIALNLVMSDQALLGSASTAAHLQGYGPIPAEVARTLIDRAAADPRTAATVRRLYASPKTGALVAMESTARKFPRGLATFIGLRDQTCRTPYCDAPIRHRDHAKPWNHGGPTTTHNGLGTCVQCNLTKESPGWRVITHTDNGTHTADYLTPTGACYHSTAPPIYPRYDISELETAISITLIDRHAA